MHADPTLSIVRCQRRFVQVILAYLQGAALLAAMLLCSVGRSAQAECEPVWHPFISGGEVGVSSAVYAMTVWNGDLIAGGSFATAGGQIVNNIARWDGSAWRPFVVDKNGVERIGVLYGDVYALTVLNGDLIAGGSFVVAGDQTVNRIARWDGSVWHPLVTVDEFGDEQVGMNGSVHALTVWNGALIAGGSFTTAGGWTVNHIARWDGSVWHPFTSGGVPGVDGGVDVVAEWNGDLIAGGSFTTAGGQTVNRIARWDGAIWNPLQDATGGGQPGVSNGWVRALAAWNGDLIVGGTFVYAGGNPWEGGQLVKGIVRWDGSAWHHIVAPDDQHGINANCLMVWNENLIVGGTITFNPLIEPSKRIARWDGFEWHYFTSSCAACISPYASLALQGNVHALTVWNDDIIVGGHLSRSCGHLINNIARYRGGIEVVDPNVPYASLIDETAVVADVNMLASYGTPVVGLAADGVTRVVLRFRVPGPGNVSWKIRDEFGATVDVGFLSWPDANSGSSELQTAAVSLDEGGWMAFAILRAPEDFVRYPYHPVDADAASRELRVTADYLPVDGGDGLSQTRTLEIRRPPVVLLHGLADNSSSWKWDLLNDTRWIIGGETMVVAHDYRDTNESPFVVNKRQPRLAIDHVLNKVRAKRVAVTQADVFGHSMGGLLFRLYALNEFEYLGTVWLTDFLRDDNFRMGDIHKLVTVNTPHRGSQIAEQLVTKSNTLLPLGHLARARNLLPPWIPCFQGRDVLAGAVRDLRRDSDILRIINESESAVPLRVRAIYGTNVPPSTTKYARRIQNLLDFFCSAVSGPYQLFGGDHDTVVSVHSQRGGLDGANIYGVYGSEGLHWPTISGQDTCCIFSCPIGSGATNSAAVQMLNVRRSHVTFADGFPLHSEPPFEQTLICVPKIVDYIGAAMELLETVVEAGTPVITSVIGQYGFNLSRVLMTTSSGDTYEINEPPYVLHVHVPETWLGPFELTAIAMNEDGDITLADPVSVHVVTSSALVELSAIPAELYLFAYAPNIQLSITGLFDDGVWRNVTDATFGTEYTVLGPANATVDENGLVTAQATGSTVIRISNQGSVLDIPVNVVTAPADWTGSGNVGMDDFDAFVGCFSGPNSDPNFVMPGHLCRDFFDFDQDGDVDCDDWETFKTFWTGPPAEIPFFSPCACAFADLNCDGVVDAADLLIVLSGWGTCSDVNDCLADLNGDGVVDTSDLLIILSNWS